MVSRSAPVSFFSLITKMLRSEISDHWSDRDTTATRRLFVSDPTHFHSDFHSPRVVSASPSDITNNPLQCRRNSRASRRSRGGTAFLSDFSVPIINPDNPSRCQLFIVSGASQSFVWRKKADFLTDRYRAVAPHRWLRLYECCGGGLWLSGCCCVLLGDR